MEVIDKEGNELLDEFNSLSEEFKNLKKLHKTYTDTMKKVFALQSKCNKELDHQNYRLSTILTYLDYFEKVDLKKHPDEELKQSALDLRENINQRNEELQDISNSLPQKNTWFLRLCLGSVNLSILSPSEKFTYKDSYEQFKFTIHIMSMTLSLLNFFMDSDFLAVLFKFLLVWYYCTLTLREAILKLNGSRIRGWWRMHHFVFITLAGLLLLWPEDNPLYIKHFRTQLLFFSVYISFVHFLQFKYQKEVMYRLRALGKGHHMDLTVEGFHSFMFRGLGFLLPFHIILYGFELYNAKILWTLFLTEPEATWHVPVIGTLFFVVFLGNFITLIKAVPRKFKEAMNLKRSFSLVLDKMKKASSSNSLSVAVQKIRKLSSATSLANLSNVLKSDLYYTRRKSKVDNSEKYEDDQFDQYPNNENNNDPDDDVVFAIDTKMNEKVTDNNNDKSDRYPLKKFLHLSHRVI